MTLKQFCYTLCIVCIVLGVVLSMAMIWGEVDSEVVWKMWLTILVFFGASAGTLIVTNALGHDPTRGGPDPPNKEA